MSVTVRQKREQQICMTFINIINQTALGSFHSPAAPHLARPVDVPGKPCAMTPLGKTGSLAQCQRLWLSVPRDACIFLCCFYVKFEVARSGVESGPLLTAADHFCEFLRIL